MARAARALAIPSRSFGATSARFLGIHNKQNIIIIGAGNIGSAVALSDSFRASNFETVAVFDVDPAKIGKRIGDLTGAQLCGYRSVSQSASGPYRRASRSHLQRPRPWSDRLYELGVNAYWNFAPTDLTIPNGATIVSVHLEEGLQILSYRFREHDSEL